MKNGDPFRRRPHQIASWTGGGWLLALAALFALTTIAAAQQAQKEQTGQQGKTTTQSAPKETQPPAKGARQSGQGTAQGATQQGQGGSGDKTAQSGQQPSGMPTQATCPCPLVTKDPVEPHFQEVCGKCHAPDRIIGARKSGLEWKETIDKMILKGAQVSDDDYDVILGFLVRNFDRVDINWVESGELVVALGLTNEEAEKIVAYRKEHGDFKDFDTLTKVPGVDVKKLEAKKSSFAFK